MSEQMCRVTVEGEVREYRAGTSYQKIAEDFQSRYDHQIVLVFAGGFHLQELRKAVERDCELKFVTTADAIGHEAYKRMGELRKLPFIPYSSLRIESIDNEAFMIARFSRNNAVIAIINRCPRKRNVSVDLFALPSDSAVLWYGNGSLSIKDRFLEAELPAEESIVVFLSGGSLPTA